VNTAGLLAADLRQARRRLRGPGGRLVAIALAGGTALFLGAEIYFLRLFLTALDRASALAPDLARLLLERAVGAALAVSIAMLITSNLVAALGSFFRAEDLELLRQSPLSDLALLAHRFLRTAVPASLPVMLFLLPLAATLAFHHGGSPSELIRYAAVVGAGLVLTFIPPSVFGCAATVLLMRFVPVRYATRLILATGLLFAVGGVVALRVLRPERLASPLSGLDLVAFASALEIPGEGTTPSSWAARLLIDALPGGPGAAGSFYPLALFAIFTLILGAILVRNLYATAWARSREDALPANRRPAFVLPPSRFFPQLSRSSAALLDREIRFFVRDASRWSQAALLAGLLAVYVYNLRSFASPDPLSRILLLYVDLATVGFVLASVSLRFAFPALSSEGGGIVILRVSPVSPGLVVGIKLAVVALPSFVLAITLTILTNHLLDIPQPLSGLAVLASAAMGITLPSLSLGLGARFPRYDASDPSELALSPPGIAAMLAGLAYIAVVVLLSCRPLLRLLLTMRGFPAESRFETPLLAGAILIVSIVSAWIPLRSGIRSLERSDL